MKYVCYSISILLLLFISNYSYINNTYTNDKLQVIENKLNEETIALTNTIYSPITIQDSIVYYLFKHNVEHPNIVIRQFILESGYFQSDLFVNHNNGIGMKPAILRYSSNVGVTENGYAKYKSIEDCIIDYKVWQDIYCSNKTSNEYYTYLQKVYAEDKYYIVKLKKIQIK